MDLRTGDIRELLPGEEPKSTEVEVEKLPDKNCKDCFGRGYLTKIIRYKVPCNCVSIKKSENDNRLIEF